MAASLRTRSRALARLLAAAALLLAGLASAQADLRCPPLAAGIATDDAGDAYARGLLWRVSPAQGRPSVVFGTMHVSDPRVTHLADVVRREFEAHRRFVLEVLLDDGALLELHAAMFYGDGRRLADVAGRDLFEAAAARLAAYGIPRAVAATMKPWAAFTTLSLPPGSAAPPLDLRLMAAAQAAGKPVIGLETVAEQIAIFENIPPAAQLDMLRESVCHYEDFQRGIERMVAHYVARDLGQLMRLSLRYADADRLAFIETLLWQRNERMAERLLPILARGDAFIAVGALHLPGARGLLRLLEQRGYRIEAIY